MPASRWVVASAAALTILLACRDGAGPSPELGTPTPPIPAPLVDALIVSNSTNVYVSLPPGNVPGGERVVVTNRRTDALAEAAMVDGGFDPLAVAAIADDTLDIVVHLAAGEGALETIALVPLFRPPVVVRSDPRPGRRDVPLNAVMLLVFSEPLDPATITPATIRLSAGGPPVVGALAFVDQAHLMVTLTAAQPLDFATEYTLAAGLGIRDAEGEALQAPVTITFVTQPDVSGVVGTYEMIDPPGDPRLRNWYVLRSDSRFELHYKNFAFLGGYSVNGAAISFLFDDRNTGGLWEATGTISGTILTVAYNTTMGLAGFDDASYSRTTTAVRVSAPTEDSQ